MKLLIVDGYNVLRSTKAYSDLADRDFESARARLVDDVAAVAQGDYEAIIVFDGASNPHSDGSPHAVAGVTVIFSAWGVDADSVIEKLARGARDQGREVMVATSDATMQWTVMGSGVTRMSAAELVRGLDDDIDEMSEHTPSGSTKGFLSERITADMRRRLDEWARG